MYWKTDNAKIWKNKQLVNSLAVSLLQTLGFHGYDRSRYHVATVHDSEIKEPKKTHVAFNIYSSANQNLLDKSFLVFSNSRLAIIYETKICAAIWFPSQNVNGQVKFCPGKYVT